jgi:ferredoxin-NADP reductase
MRWEAQDVLSISLTRPDGTELPSWELGAHIDVILSKELARPYSLCGSLEDRTSWTIAVLREPQSSGGSQYIHEVLRPGMTVGVIGPRNNFALVDAPSYLFIAGGIGVTPLIPMVEALADRSANWTMLYGGRHRESMAFLDRLLAHAPYLQVSPENEYGLLDLASAIGGASEDTAIYCCGPEALISAVEATCERAGREPPHVERFKGRALEVDTSSDKSFEVVIENTGERLLIPEDRSILEILGEHGFWVPSSCTEGYCGMCITDVVAGTPDHRDDYLSEEVRASNTKMMICVGRSKSPELSLRLAI